MNTLTRENEQQQHFYYVEWALPHIIEVLESTIAELNEHIQPSYYSQKHIEKIKLELLVLYQNKSSIFQEIYLFITPIAL
jgi:hypothetical protein